MKNNYTTYLIICNVVLLTIVCIVLYLFNATSKGVVYVDNIELFNGFNMSNDLGKMNAKKINSQKKKLDSLYTIYSIFRQQENVEKMKEVENYLREEDQELKQMNDFLSKDMHEKIWGRLNQYIKEYGEANKCKIILGTQGNGNIFYGKEELNITTKILEYANTKYEGN